MNGLCEGQWEDHVLQPPKSLDLKIVVGNIGLIRLPREDVVCVGAGKGVTGNVSSMCERCDVAVYCDRSCFKDCHNTADP
jgi:hypothetical protein